MKRSITFAARARVDKEPRVVEVVTRLKDRGFTDRQILKMLVDQFEDFDTRDDMIVSMTGAVLRRYIVEAIKEIMPDLLRDAMGNIHVIQSTPDGAAAPTGQTQPEVSRLIGHFSTLPDEKDEDDYSVW